MDIQRCIAYPLVIDTKDGSPKNNCKIQSGRFSKFKPKNWPYSKLVDATTPRHRRGATIALYTYSRGHATSLPYRASTGGAPQYGPDLGTFCILLFEGREGWEGPEIHVGGQIILIDTQQGMYKTIQARPGLGSGGKAVFRPFRQYNIKSADREIRTRGSWVYGETANRLS